VTKPVSNMTDQDATLKELKSILKVLILENADAIEKELSKIATTDERKKMWVLMDGKRMPKDVANEAGVTKMAVSNFLSAGMTAELIEYVKGEPPRRILDYVPPTWINLVKLPPLGGLEEKEGASLDNAVSDEGYNDVKKNQ